MTVRISSPVLSKTAELQQLVSRIVGSQNERVDFATAQRSFHHFMHKTDDFVVVLILHVVVMQVEVLEAVDHLLQNNVYTSAML